MVKPIMCVGDDASKKINREKETKTSPLGASEKLFLRPL